MKTILVSLLLASISIPACCQDSAVNCEVVPLPIQGKYYGECKYNKAHGHGKSVGMDTYEGNFKNGYPDGEGKYTWQNGNNFTGTFKKGIKIGKGEMRFLRKSREDSVVIGFWEKDNYHGQYEKPYDFINTGNEITYKNVAHHTNSGSQSVRISMESGVLATADISNFTIRDGSYVRTNTTELTRTKIIEFQTVVFPFRVEFRLEKGPIEIAFYEDGEWNVELVL